jgi:hypothetical protein
MMIVVVILNQESIMKKFFKIVGILAGLAVLAVIVISPDAVDGSLGCDE